MRPSAAQRRRPDRSTRCRRRPRGYDGPSRHAAGRRCRWREPMPISAALAGRTLGPREVTLSARRIMAFAAATDDRNPRYFDDTGGPPIAPPLLAVSLEWPLLVALRADLPGVSAAELRRGVHAAHDVTIHRLPAAGETLRTAATVVALERRPSGAGLLTRLDTVDAAGRSLWTTYNRGVYRGVELAGEPVRLDAPPALPAGSPE